MKNTKSSFCKKQRQQLCSDLPQFSNKRMGSAKRTAAKSTQKKKRVKRTTLYASQNRSTVRGIDIRARGVMFRPSYFKTHTGGYPQRWTETLRQAWYGGTGAIAANAFTNFLTIASNNPYLPYAAATNNPGGWAKLMTVYTKCCVRAAKVTITFTNVDAATTNVPVIAGITSSTTPTTFASFPVAAGCGLTTFRQFQNNPDTVTLTQSHDVGKMVSVDDLLDGSQWYCTAVASPSQMTYFQVWVQNAAGVASYVDYHVILDVECIFFDPLPIV